MKTLIERVQALERIVGVEKAVTAQAPRLDPGIFRDVCICHRTFTRMSDAEMAQSVIYDALCSIMPTVTLSWDIRLNDDLSVGVVGRIK